MEDSRNVNGRDREAGSDEVFCELGPLSPAERGKEAFLIRLEEAREQYYESFRQSPIIRCNGDEEVFENKIGNFSKA